MTIKVSIQPSTFRMPSTLCAVVICNAAAVFLIFAAFFTTTGVAAQDTPLLATMTARAVPDVTLDSEIKIRHLEDTELNLRLRDHISDLLQKRGYRIVDQGVMVLTFDTTILSDEARQTRVEMSGFGGDKGGNRFQLSLKLPSSRTTSRPTERRYRVKMSLSRDGEAPLWVGFAAAQRGSDRFAITLALTTELISVIGKTVEQQAFVIQ